MDAAREQRCMNELGSSVCVCVSVSMALQEFDLALRGKKKREKFLKDSKRKKELTVIKDNLNTNLCSQSGGLAPVGTPSCSSQCVFPAGGAGSVRDPEGSDVC